MANSNTNWHFVYLQFQQSCYSHHPEKQAKQKISEMESALIRIVLPLMGYTEKPKGRYLTAEDKQAAFDFMKTLPLKKLPEGLRLLEEKGHTLPLTKNSLNTYGARARQWFEWAKDNAFWPLCHYK